MASSDYPYTGKKGQECKYDNDKSLIAANGITMLNNTTPYLMQSALEMGPITAIVDASSKSFMQY